MSDSIVHFASTAPRAASTERRAVLVSLGLVVGFWWAATGLTLAMQASAIASTSGVLVTSVLALLGAVLIITSRNEPTVRGARAAFLGSALVWWWCAAVFYAGLGIVLTGDAAGASGSLALALQAIRATLLPDSLGVIALVLSGVYVWRAPNRLAFWSLMAFWGTLQTAKLNVFFGVRNASVEWLPAHLAGLTRYFGPPVNSELLPVTILALVALCAATAVRARRRRDEFSRHSYAMLTLLLALAVVEHAFLGVGTTLPLWNIFMVRG